MKLHLLFSYVALLSIGFMPQAVAKPRSEHTNPFQAQAVPALLETPKSFSVGSDEVQNPESDAIPNPQFIEAQPLVPISEIPRLGE